jgi:anti-sigma-K factor RskA
VTHPVEPLMDYALGSLEAGEATQLEAHLRSCPPCRAEVTRLKATLSLLAEELEPVAPPRGSWDRVRSKLHAPRRSFVPRWALPAAAAVLLVATGTFGLAWWRDQQDLREIHDNQALVSAWMTNPDVRLVLLTQRSGRAMGHVLLLKDGRALVVMPEAAPTGQSYQAWGLYEHARTAPATSLGVSNRAVFEVQMRPYPWFWLSLEPSGGSKVPTQGIGWSKVDGG